ncbi:MAG TPA: hypothetical protein VN581_00755 [Patescibacteria group bacterium]|nr:hypothetical protein [Patescibacteria group bacterium]
MTRPAFTAVALLFTVALAWIGVLDRVASSELDGALKRSFAAFAIARSLNGVISLVQDADVSVSPAGVGVTVSPGELLDPLNDLLEQFSTLAFTALTALGIQKFALQLSDSLLLNLGLSAAATLWFAAQFWPRAMTWQALAARALVFALALRFLVPGFALATALVDRTLLTPEFEAAKAQLQLTTDAVQAAAEPVPHTEPTGIGEQITRWWETAKAEIDVRERVGRIKDIVENAAEPLVTLAVVFLLQAIVLPLAFLALGTQLLRASLAGVLQPRPPH